MLGEKRTHRKLFKSYIKMLNDWTKITDWIISAKWLQPGSFMGATIIVHGGGRGGSVSDKLVAIDSNATPGYLGALASDGVFRVDSNFTYTDGGDYITIGLESLYEDVQFGISNAKVPAANAPTWQTFTTNTNEYGFAVDEYIDCEANEMPHSWAEGTAARLHLHITTKGANASGVNQYVKFTVYVSYAKSEEVTGDEWTETSFTAELTIPDGTAVLESFFLDMGSNLTLTGYTIGTQVKVRVKRIAATSGDPTEYPGDIFITQVGLHAIMNTLGSRQLLVK